MESVKVDGKKFCVQATERNVVRTWYYVEAQTAQEAESLCKSGKIGYEEWQFLKADPRNRWVKTESVELLAEEDWPDETGGDLFPEPDLHQPYRRCKNVGQFAGCLTLPPLQRYVVTAIEKFLYRTNYYLEANTAKQAEELCKSNKVPCHTKESMDSNGEWIRTESVKLFEGIKKED